jgi:hypothetical protein
MGEAIKNTGNEAVKRWQEKMPKFFRWMMYLCGMVAGMTVAINTAFASFGITPHEWWTDICPYLIGVPVGAMFCAKFTVDGGMRDKTIEQLNKNTVLDKDDN